MEVTLKRVYPKRTCCVCLMEFDLAVERHYIARDKSMSGLSSAWSSPEPELYDSIDCPICGCQNILQKRKRNFVTEADFEIDEPEVDEDEEEEVPRALDMVDAMRFGVAGVGAPSSLNIDDALEKLRRISNPDLFPTQPVIMSREELEKVINSDLAKEIAGGKDELWGCDNQEADDPEDDEGPGVDLDEVCI